MRFRKGLKLTLLLSLAISLPSLPFNNSHAIGLRDAIQYTLTTNPDVLISIEQRQQSNEIYKQDFAGYLPSFDTMGEDGSERTRNQNTSNAFENLNRKAYTLNLTENIFNGLQTYHNVRSDLANIASQAYKVNDSAQNTALAVSEVYLNVLRSQQLVAIARENVALHVKTRDMIGKREKRGLSSTSELQQTNGRLALARSDLLEQLRQLQDAKAQFLKVVGIPVASLKNPDYKGHLALPNTKQQAILNSILDNPALRASRYDLNAAIEIHQAAKSSFYPSVNIIASRTRGENIGGQVGPNDDDSLYAEANFNLFRGGADFARYKQTAYQAQEAFSNIEKTRRDVISNTEMAWNAWQTSKKNLDQLYIHQMESAKVVTAFTKQYTVGKRTLLDLLNAQSEEIRAKSNYLDGKFNILLNRYRVLANEGLLLQYFAVALPDAASTSLHRHYYKQFFNTMDNTPTSRNPHHTDLAQKVHTTAVAVKAEQPQYTTTYTISKVNAKPQTASHHATKTTKPVVAKIKHLELKPNYTVSQIKHEPKALAHHVPKVTQHAAKKIKSSKPKAASHHATKTTKPVAAKTKPPRLKPTYTVSKMKPEPKHYKTTYKITKLPNYHTDQTSKSTRI